MPASTKGAAFEIRFCENNVVKVYDLTQRLCPVDKRLLPGEYDEKDLLKGRLRFSKLGGGDWAASEEQYERTANYPKTERPKPKVIPAVAKRRVEDDEKERQRIREGEEAVQKAMERKARIAQARNASRQRNAQQVESLPQTSSSSIHTPSPAALKIEHHSPSLDQYSFARATNSQTQFSPLSTPIPAKTCNEQSDYVNSSSHSASFPQALSVVHEPSTYGHHSMTNRESTDKKSSTSSRNCCIIS